MLMVVLPAPEGWKLAVSKVSPSLNTAEPMVPTPLPAGGMDIGTVYVAGYAPEGPGFSWPPPRYVRVPGFRMAGSRFRLVGGERVVVVMAPWLGLMMKPDGYTVTAPVPLL